MCTTSLPDIYFVSIIMFNYILKFYKLKKFWNVPENIMTNTLYSNHNTDSGDIMTDIHKGKISRHSNYSKSPNCWHHIHTQRRWAAFGYWELSSKKCFQDNRATGLFLACQPSWLKSSGEMRTLKDSIWLIMI